ncbi:hypothetical protein CapIbe_021966 [Capra ibex]
MMCRRSHSKSPTGRTHTLVGVFRDVVRGYKTCAYCSVPAIHRKPPGVGQQCLPRGSVASQGGTAWLRAGPWLSGLPHTTPGPRGTPCPPRDLSLWTTRQPLPVGAEEPWQLHLTSHHPAKRKDTFFRSNENPRMGSPWPGLVTQGSLKPRAESAPPKQQGLRQELLEEDSEDEGGGPDQGEILSLLVTSVASIASHAFASRAYCRTGWQFVQSFILLRSI